MVVSKEKRKRKSPPPQPSAVESSSPEMPKRTKVQAQRKFAQGQSAPTSSYNTSIIAAAASSSSNTGPSTSSESREPPTELLPNKRPKTEDFLTFLCFRGTSALPAHLDFLNQGKSKEPDTTPVRKKIPKVKAAKKSKKTRSKANTKNAETKVLSPKTTAAANTPVSESTGPQEKPPKPEVSTSEETVIPFAVRKRAEITAEGSRAGRGRTNDRQLRNNTENQKCNNSPDNKRRSNRTSTKDVKPMLETETDEDEEYFSANDDVEKIKSVATNSNTNLKAPKPEKSRDEPSPCKEIESEKIKESENGKTLKGKVTPAQGAKKGKENAVELNKTKESLKAVEKNEEKPIKEKVQCKRPRQKESPIFIPSPEPSGRMTRQRAFFEPVKVPHRNESPATEGTLTGETKKETAKSNAPVESGTKPKRRAPEAKNVKETFNDNVLKDSKAINDEKPTDHNKNKANLHVFDFSSDDEQPLAKQIKLKRGKASPKKATTRSTKTVKKVSPKKSLEKKEEIKQKEPEKQNQEVGLEAVLEEKLVVSEESPEEEPKVGKGRRGKSAPKKLNVDEHATEKQEQAAPSPKKLTSQRQSKKKLKGDNHVVNSDEEHDDAAGTARNQRPSRKTKEAAAIYMGIIGQKLQQADDEDDDLSLNSFPDLPNVKEMEKMELELKKNATQTSPAKSSTALPILPKTTPKQTITSNTTPATAVIEKPTSGRRGRPPKNAKQLPVKREIEGMLIKKGALAKLAVAAETVQNKEKSEATKIDSEDEDFLLNEAVKETKRNLEKSFSDSDDEPLAIKAHVKTSDKDGEQDSKKSDYTPHTIHGLTMLPLTTKPVVTPPPLGTIHSTNISPIVGHTSMTSQTPSPFKTIEKKSPVPQSKILNVPATYALPGTTTAAGSVNMALNANFNKTSSYLPQASPHYNASHGRSNTHQFAASTAAGAIPGSQLPTTVMPPQSPLKFQTPPITYPPPIEAYPSPKINPNFLTPKFDRGALPRANNFPSPSPMKYDLVPSTSKVAIGGNATMSPKTPPISASGNAATTTANSTVNSPVTVQTNDPLKDEIGSILAANLMPNEKEAGKIFGIASVTLAQSSGPDNTKCTLGKCGSVHKPVLGPSVATEVYTVDQLTGKERRKAKVNMTHEQIQKWLIECSSNPDDIQDDLEDDLDDHLRPNIYVNTPPLTRDDKESTSFSSSSKATRDLGKSESAWSAKGPSLKATPVIASRRDLDHLDISSDFERSSMQAMNLTHKTNLRHATLADVKMHHHHHREKVEKKTERKPKEDKTTVKETTSTKDNKSKLDKEKEKIKDHLSSSSLKATAASGKQAAKPVSVKQPPPKAQASASSSATGAKPQKKKNSANIIAPAVEKIVPPKSSAVNPSANISPSVPKSSKRTPVYNQKTAKPSEPKDNAHTTSATSHKKLTSYAYGAFSADNEKSIYSFDKDDDDDHGAKSVAKPEFRRQSRRESQCEDVTTKSVTPTTKSVTPTTKSVTPTTKTAPQKKRAAAATAEIANREIANASQNSSVSLTLSPSENSKLVKVSLESEKASTKAAAAKSAKSVKKTETPKTATNEADSDSDGHTFYIPLQGAGASGDSEGIQGVAVKLGREGPDGPNQKVIMHATLVTKAQMGSNSKPLPDSMNVSDIVKTLMTTSTTSITAESSKKGASTTTPTSNTATPGPVAPNSASNSLKNVPIGTVQPRFKGADPSATSIQPPASSSSLVRVNSNSSLFSGSAKSRMGGPGPSTHIANKKYKDDMPMPKMSNNTAFPRHDDPTQMVEAPIFRPTEKEFADPIEFIERITPIAARFGICKIIPPSTFRPECRISDEMRFTAYNQYVHKMLHRWGPSAKELSAIKKYLATQSIVMNHPPWIGGMEVDLPRLYHTVQELGGLKEVIEKKKWARVAEEMCIPKLAQDRVTKLDDIYCKYLLPYDTLSPCERQKLFDEVEADWAKREARARRNADRFGTTESVSNEEDDVSSDDEDESEEEVDGVSMECIVKGRSMPLSQFYRIARNTMALWFKNTEPTVNEVEAEFWRHVAVRDSHVCVHSGSIDSSGWGYGFPSPGPKSKGSNYGRHPWNLKVLTNNVGSVLRSLGPVMGVTVPTLHVGMLFSACCWYRDPHGLSWIEYLHTGASKLWYGIPDDQSANFRAALTSLIPTHCQNKTIWLPCDTVMVPPHMLTDRGVSLCRIEQRPGEFIVVFPRAYTSSLATGYVVSESVYFATTSWLDLAKDDFRDIHDSCEPAMFSLEQLLFALGYDQRVTIDTLQQMLPMLHEVIDKETAAREQLKAAGITVSERVQNEKASKAKKQQPPFKSIESECDLCRANLYISMVKTDEGNIYCLQHAIKHLNNGNIQAKHCKLIYAYDVDDIDSLIKNLKDKIQQKRNAEGVDLLESTATHGSMSSSDLIDL